MASRVRVRVEDAKAFTLPVGAKVIRGTVSRDGLELVLSMEDLPLVESEAGTEMCAEAHYVRCPSCSHRFDLFAASWCLHPTRPSKVCPRCSQCACGDANYKDPRYWREAPAAFRRHGVYELFALYL